VLVALLCLDVGLAFLWVLCLLGGHLGLAAYLEAAGIAGVTFLAILILAITGSRALRKVLRGLDSHWIWTFAIMMPTSMLLVLTLQQCRHSPSAYMELILDNGPAPEGHRLDELKAVLQEELSRTLPNSALALRVFGLRCGEAERVVNFQRGNAGRVAEALGEVQAVAYADLTGAVRWALDDLLAQQGQQPRVAVLVTWGNEGCGGDLAKTLDTYRAWLGESVSLSVITLGDRPLDVSQPGITVVQVTRIEDVGRVMAQISGALEMGSWPPVPTPPTPTPTRRSTATPSPTPTDTPTPTATPTPTPTKFSTCPVGDAPSALTFDGESIWVANRGDDTVMKLNGDGDILHTSLVGGSPDGLAYDGQDIWVLNDESRNVMKLAPDGMLLGTYEDVGSYPQAIAFYDGNLWVVSQTYYGAGSVFRLALDGSRRGIYSVGDTANALTFDRESVWVTNSGEGTVSRLTFEGEPLGTFAVGDTPTAITFDGENIWVAADRLVCLTLEGEVSGIYDLKDKPTDLLFDGNELWVVSSWGHSVTRVTRDGEVVDTYDVGGWASDLTFDGENIWVTNMTDDVVVKLPAGR
jgi:hypothetical protein